MDTRIHRGVPTPEQLRREAAFTSEVLDLIENRDAITDSDLDAALGAIYRKYFGEART